MATSPTTFPGFYASVIDKSFAPVTLSRFRGGLTGVANKGPFNTPTLVNSLTEFANKFGDSNVTNDAGWAGQLAVTAASVADFSGSSLIVRIGHQYESTGVVDNASGAASGTSTITVTNANHFTVGDYIRIIDAQGEVETTSNAVISNVNVGADTITIDTPLQYTYANGSTIYRSSQSGAATSAEAFLSAFTFVTNRVGSGSSATVSGTKGEFTLECTADLSKKTITAISASGGTVTATTSSAHNYAVGDQIKIENVVASSGNGVFNGTYTLLTASGSTFTYASLTSFSDTGISATVGGVMTAAALSAGDLIKISNSTNPTVGLATDTGEVLVKSVVANNTTGGCTITLYPSGVTSLGYQSLPLQANYTTARIYKVKRADGLDSGGAFDTYRILHLWASSEGTWANSDSATNSNLVVGIGPGSAAGSKKLLVFYNTELVETIDNLTYLDSTADTFFPTKVNATSAYVRVGYDGIADEFLVNDVPPANTLDGWNITNLGGKTNVANFTGGDNGANTENSDWVGDLNPTTDLYTGFQSFRNETDYQVNVLAIPGATDTDLQQNLVQVARVLNAVAILDVAETTVPRQYADWRNAAGQFTNRTKIDDWHGALFANWVDIIDPYTTETRRVPPSVEVVRCMARTFNNDKPWYATAGEIRGFCDNAQGLQFRTINFASKTQAYESNVNLIVSNNGRIQIYGDRTLQVADSKLMELHVAILVNYIIANIGVIARQFVFDPNDTVLLAQLNQAITQFMDGIQNERGVEQYKLVVDGSNNNAETRALREVIIDLGIVPTSTADRIFLNLTVNRSGAQLNA
jgi:hypothetical protein